MALPMVKTLTDCADYEKVFGSYLPQLYDLAIQTSASIYDVQALKHLYLSTNPAISGLALAIATFPVFFIVSEINKNYSQVDRVWSIMPTIFNVHYAIWARLNGLPTGKVDNVMAFSIVWSLRLTYNYWRRGGYQVGSEDYRWELIKGKIGTFGFTLLNIFFIASIQPVLLWAVTLPTYLLMLTSLVNSGTVFTDILFGRFLMALVVFEYFADQQQWNFQEAKQEYKRTAKVPAGWTRAQMDRGFVTTGLWKYSRHPNFAAEQSIWILLYLWSCFETSTTWNWTVGGVISYVLIFAGSTPITEWISKGKYPEYGLYQERVGRFVPKLLGKGWNEKEAEIVEPQYTEKAKKG